MGSDAPTTTTNLLVPLLLLLLLVLAQGGEARVRHSKARCSKCAPGWGVAAACGVSSPTRCVPCVEGRSYSPHNSFRAPCWLCSRCGEGLFEARPCSSTSDTVCDACGRVDDSRGRPKDFYRKCLNATALKKSTKRDTHQYNV